MRKIFLPVLLLLISACSRTAEVPVDFVRADGMTEIYPDYTDVTIPPNIAPLNFNITSCPKKAVVTVDGENGGKVTAAADADGSVRFDIAQWNDLLQKNTGADLAYTIYTYDGNGWTMYPEFKNHVAAEEIDPYISYRLIEPGYVAYYNLGIYQRNLSCFAQTPIYRNNGDHCINCHTYQNRRADHMIFHVRENHGGTVLVENGKVEKMNLKADSMYTSCVYPSWHPTQNKIAFSVNMIGQYFFLLNPEKVEVMDEVSDLVLFDVDSREIMPVANDPNCLETFPSWSPEGDRLYYSVCRNLRYNKDYIEGRRVEATARAFDTIFYDIWSVPYDTLTGTFGQARPEFEASAEKKSATLSRISPDGRWLLFTLGKSGQFHIWHKSSDLYVKDLQTGDVHPLSAANSEDVDSFHTWSSNGRWIVFSTRREDGCYTRPYFCYFDKEGKDHKPFALPQEDPLQSKLLLRSYNLPEFMTGPVEINEEDFRNVIINTEPTPSKYITSKSQ